MSLGSRVDWKPPAVLVHARLPIAGATTPEFSQPFSPEPSSNRPTILWAIWICGVTVHALAWSRRWRGMRAALASATPIAVEAPIAVLTTSTRVEPGVFGIFRPVLLLPRASPIVSPPHSSAPSCFTNCAMFAPRQSHGSDPHAESVFWFAPPLWYIRARLIEKRERACDEHVLAQTESPEEYAEGILSVCRFYVATPLLCSSGVTGSDLRRRIDEIVSSRIVRDLNSAKKLLLAGAAVAAIGLPIFTGMLSAADSVAFEVASVKRSKDTGGRPAMEWSVLPGGRLSIKGFQLKAMISTAYHVPIQSVRLSGGPDWIRTEVYDIEATPPKGSIPEGLSNREVQKKGLRDASSAAGGSLQTHDASGKQRTAGLCDRGRQGRFDSQRAPVEEAGCEAAASRHQIAGGQGRGLHAKAVTISDITNYVENWTDRPMVDKTGLAGLFEVDTEGWIPMVGPVNPGPARACRMLFVPRCPRCSNGWA